jgi:hypothetical protein
MKIAAALFYAASPASAADFSFTTGDPDGLMATGSRPASTGKIDIESADDFLLTQPTRINSATFTGLLPTGFSAGDIVSVGIEIYRVFPNDSTDPPSGNVPTRNNSPSDVALLELDSGAGDLSFATAVLNASFQAANSVLNGINPSPGQTTGGEGAVTGEEVRFDITFTNPLLLLPDHYFFVPQVELSTGDFLWLSAPRPNTIDPFAPDLQTWIRDENLDPDWLRVGTDIVGPGADTPAPAFNGAFSLNGEAVPLPAAVWSSLTALLALAALHLRRRATAV